MGHAAAAGERDGVSGAQGTVDGRGEVVLVEPHHDAQVGPDGPRVQGGLQVRDVHTGQGEQGVRPAHPCRFEHALLGHVAQDDGYAQAPGEFDTACLGVGFHAHYGDLQFPQPGQHPRSDLAEAQQDDVVRGPAGRAAQGGRGPEGAQPLQCRRDKDRQQEQPHEAA